MPSNAPSFGVPSVSFSTVDTATSIPSLAAATVTAAALTPTSYNRNSVLAPLSNTGYKVAVALLGFDVINNGYTFNIASPLSSTVTPTVGQGILINIANPLPANMTGAIAAAIFIQKGTASPQLAEFAYIDAIGGTQFTHLLMNEPLGSAPQVSSALLAAATSTALLGSRAPKGVLYTPFTPTTRGVKFNRKAIKVPVSPDNGPDYEIVTVRSTDLQFSVLADSLTFLSQALGGDTWTFTDTDSTIVDQMQSDMYAVVANVQGNRPLLIQMPPDHQGKVINRLHMGNLVINQAEFTESRLKNEAFALDFNLQAAALDALMVSMFAGISWARH